MKPCPIRATRMVGLAMVPILSPNRTNRLLDGQLFLPGYCAANHVVHRPDVLHTLTGEPILQRIRALAGIHRKAFLPGSAPTQDARELRTRFSSHSQRFGKLLVAHPGAEVD